MKDEFVAFTSAVIREGGEVLIARRKRAFMGYVWEFPGGKPEDEETLKEGLERIVGEEFGIDVEVGEYLCSTGHAIHCELSIKSYVYEVRILSGSIILKDHEEAKWVTPGELAKYDFADHHRYVAQMLMRKEL